MREPREHLKTLQRRVDFLKSRDHKNSFDQAELGSLEWALINLQPERKPLTDEEIEKLREKTFSTGNPYCPVDSKSMRKAARAIEAAHQIGVEK